jgi:hypothetical protein
MGLWAHRTPRKQRQRGAVMIEAAIVMPLLITLVMGIIDFGMVFSDQQTVGSSSRAGARAAVAYSRQANFELQGVAAAASALSAQTSGEPISLWIYRVGFDNGAPVNFENFEDCIVDCIQFTWDTNSDTFVNSGVGGGWNYQTMNACTLPLHELGVRVKVRHDMVTGLFGDTKILTDETIMRLEPQPLSTCG